MPFADYALMEVYYGLPLDVCLYYYQLVQLLNTESILHHYFQEKLVEQTDTRWHFLFTLRIFPIYASLVVQAKKSQQF